MVHQDLRLHRGGQAVVEVEGEVTSLERVVMAGLEVGAPVEGEEDLVKLVMEGMVGLVVMGMWLW